METVTEPNKPQPSMEAATNRVAPADKRLANLDLLRGVAALLVCAGHLRAFLFVDYAHVIAPNMFVRAFYFVTGLGHQAVVIFFVLSGYLVGGSVLAAYESGRWSWMKYASRRMTRLWVVLLPALVLTFVLDSLGRHYAHDGYAGGLRALYNSGPTPEIPTDLRLTTFLGNAFFLQTIAVNCFGTNGPLWSLANEFWYYALFPLFCTVIFAFRRPTSSCSSSRLWSRIAVVVICSLLFASLVWWLPSALVWSGVIWCFGVIAYWTMRFSSVRTVLGHPASRTLCSILVLGTLVASKTKSVFGSDFGIGVAMSVWVVGLASREHHIQWLKRLSCGLSEMSYTLYLVHFPLLALIFFCIFAGRQLQPGIIASLQFGAILILSLGVSAAMWWCFERNTDFIRKQFLPVILRLSFA